MTDQPTTPETIAELQDFLEQTTLVVERLTGLKNQLIAQGWTPHIAEQIVLASLIHNH